MENGNDIQVLRVVLMGRESFPLLKYLVVAATVLFSARIFAADTPLTIRGTAGSLPFHLGTTLYNGAWEGFASNDHSTDWWWYDKEYWRNLFQRYEQAHLNTIVYWHPHPFVGFVKLDKYPEAAYLSPKEIDRQIEMFRWITAEGKRHGVCIYFLTWNVCLPPGFCKTHNLAEFGADVPITRGYTRYAVSQLFRTYPDLEGLVTMAAESPPGCTDFVLNTIVPGLKDSIGADSPRKNLPTLIFWTWCSYPEDGKKILDAYPGRKFVLHYLQYEQFFKPMADPRILMTSKAFGGIKVVAMGGPGTASSWLYWADPFFIRKTMQDLVRKNGGGILFSGTGSFSFLAERWVARGAFERYSFQPNCNDTREYWENRIVDRYGSKEITRPLLRAMIDSTNILPRFMCLVHSQTDHYQPQIGMPLVNFVEMPTLSMYVFENHDHISEDGRLVPCMGLTWPNPDWGEKVISIREYAFGNREGGTTPVMIADEIEGLSRSTLDAITQVRLKLDQVTMQQAELKNALLLMEMNAYLGLHFAEKIRAGIAWESWKARDPNARPYSVTAHLELSLVYWRKLSEVAGEIIPDRVPFWQSRVPKAPPWDHWDLWNNYRWVKIHWRDMTPVFELERDLIREQLKRDPEEARLPLFSELEQALPN